MLNVLITEKKPQQEMTSKQNEKTLECYQETFEVVSMLITLIMVMILWVYAYVQIQ